MGIDPALLVDAGSTGPNPYLEQMRGQQGLRAGQQQLDMGALQLAAAKQQQQQAQSYQQDVESYFKDPAPARLAGLIAKYPQQAEALKQSKAALDEPARQSQLTQYGQLFNAANAGRTDLLVKQATALKTAEAAQGIDTSEIDDVLGRLQSSDPAAQKEATKQIQALSQAHIAALDPKYAESLQKLGADANHFSSTGDSAIYDQRTGEVVRQAPEKPAQWEYDSKNERWIQKPGTGGGGQASTAGGSSGGASAGPFDPRAFFKSFTLPHEGGYAAHDANGAPVNMGVNQAANPGVDVRNLTPEQAADIFVKKYANGTENMPPALGGVFADTAYINPTRAAQFLKQSGGDPAKFLAMRKAWQASLVAKDPEKYGPYQKAWANRNRDLAQYIAQQGGSGAPAQAGGTPGVINVPAPHASENSDSLTGPAYLATLPTGRANLIKAILDGRAPAPRPGSKFGEQLAEDIAHADPSVDTTTLPVRLTTRQAFTGNGKAAQVISSINRFSSHLNSLWENHLQLGGPNLGPLSGFVAGAMQSWDPKHVKAYNQEIEALQGEFQKLTKNGVGSESEAERLIANAKAAQSEEGRAAAIQAMAKLAMAQIQPMHDQWSSAFGDKPLPVDITASSRASLSNIIEGGKAALPVDHNGTPYVPGKPQAGSPVRITSPEQLRALPVGTPVILQDGRTGRKK